MVGHSRTRAVTAVTQLMNYHRYSWLNTAVIVIGSLSFQLYDLLLGPTSTVEAIMFAIAKFLAVRHLFMTVSVLLSLLSLKRASVHSLPWLAVSQSVWRVQWQTQQTPSFAANISLNTHERSPIVTQNYTKLKWMKLITICTGMCCCAYTVAYVRYQTSLYCCSKSSRPM